MMLSPLNCICRRQFDIANREAMDESAEWRQKYDSEVDRLNKCLKKLQVVCVLFLEFLLFIFQIVWPERFRFKYYTVVVCSWLFTPRHLKFGM